jgi:hypothetical protein
MTAHQMAPICRVLGISRAFASRASASESPHGMRVRTIAW